VSLLGLVDIAAHEPEDREDGPGPYPDGATGSLVRANGPDHLVQAGV